MYADKSPRRTPGSPRPRGPSPSLTPRGSDPRERLEVTQAETFLSRDVLEPGTAGNPVEPPAR
eukprot:2478007-Pyramimonas_sp.AAC.1